MAYTGKTQRINNDLVYFDGIFGFTPMDTAELKDGDTIRDNNGLGQYAYVSYCEACSEMTIAGTRFYTVLCHECEQKFNQERLYK